MHANTQPGTQHKAFTLVFSLAEAAVETQHFVARRRELKEIRDTLRGDGSRKVVVLYGLGGIGKTQLVIAYAKQYKDFYSAILWLNAKDEDSIKSSFAKIARRILREQPSTATQLAMLDLDKDLDEVVNAVRAWLSLPMNTSWLMICDNYDNPKVPGNTNASALDLRQFLPEAYQGTIIVTTRSSEVKLGRCLRVQKLVHLEDSLQMLEDSSDRQNLAIGKSQECSSFGTDCKTRRKRCEAHTETGWIATCISYGRGLLKPVSNHIQQIPGPLHAVVGKTAAEEQCVDDIRRSHALHYVASIFRPD